MTLLFFVNGKKIVHQNPDPGQSLLYYLRHELRLCGTKEGCGVGGCGACTVMLSSYNHQQKKISHRAVVACLVPLCSVHNQAVTTVEGIGTSGNLHTIQDRLARGFGSQCGFCSPGMVMSMYSLLRANPKPSESDVQEAIQGNLCRCTGYRPILEAFQTFSTEFECPMGDKCCRNKSAENEVSQWGTPCCYDPYLPTQEPIFPPELMIQEEQESNQVTFESPSANWIRPATLQELLDAKKEYPSASIVGGHTMLGLSKRMTQDEVFITASHLHELQRVTEIEDGIKVGAAVTLNQLKAELQNTKHQKTEEQCRFFSGIMDSLCQLGSQQIRNMATVGGCVAGGLSPNDLVTSLMVLKTAAHVLSKDGSSSMHELTPEFFSQNRQKVISDGILTDVSIPFSTKDDYFQTFKHSSRKGFDAPKMNAAFFIRFQEDSNVIKFARLAFVGEGHKIILATETAGHLTNGEWCHDLFVKATRHLEQELKSKDNSWCTSVYLQSVASGFLLKFFVNVSGQHNMEIPAVLQSVLDSTENVLPKSLQVVTEATDGNDCLYRPVHQESACLHSTGEAVYIDDISPSTDELYLGLVLSDVAAGDIVSINWEEALRYPGVVDKVDHTDVQGSNYTGILLDEEVFTSSSVSSDGHVVGGIIAKTMDAAQKGAQLVKVEYTKKQKPLITVQEAIDNKSFHGDPICLDDGDTALGFSQSDHVIEGVINTGAQDHFCMETMTCIVKPKEKGAFEVYSNCQNLSNLQSKLASVLGVPMHKVECRVKRIGGGFGGKYYRSIYMVGPAAVAAQKLNHPIRCTLTREENMKMVGGRDECRFRYNVGFTEKGRITALEIDIYSNVGCSVDASFTVLKMELVYVFLVYNMVNVKARGYLCMTNTRSTTATRGFAILPAMLPVEEIMTMIADKINLPCHQVQEINFYMEGNKTPTNQIKANWTLPICWEKVFTQSNYVSSMESINNFNKDNRYKKRGISVIPSSIMVGNPIAHNNMGSALVNIFSDGSVLLTLSGVEMGQGMTTKMMQLVSHLFSIPMSKIMLTDTNTSVTPNSAPSSASMTSDYNGFAVKQACDTLLERLAPYKESNQKGSWSDWVQAAYMDRVNLSAVGYHKNDVGFNFETKEGKVCSYTVQGAAVSMVEIDCLSGQHTVLRTDIVLDVGQSINPAIDIGQVEGGFLMGYGFMTMEEVKYSADGKLQTKDPLSYKIPTVDSVPREFNVTLIKGSGEPRAVYSSKSLGEPPMFLSASVFFAIKNAIRAARKESAADANNFTLHCPATTQQIKELCLF